MNCPICASPMTVLKSCSQPAADGSVYRLHRCENGHRIAVQKDGKWRVSSAGRKRMPWNEIDGKA